MAENADSAGAVPRLAEAVDAYWPQGDDQVEAIASKPRAAGEERQLGGGSKRFHRSSVLDPPIRKYCAPEPMREPCNPRLNAPRRHF